MAQIVYCNLCGTMIPEKDLLAGRALTLLDKTFCHACKEKAFAQIRSEAPDASARPLDPAPAPRAAPAVAPAAPRVAAPERPAPRLLPIPVRRRSVLPLYVGGTVGFLALTALLILLIMQAENKNRPPPDLGGGGNGPTTAQQPADTGNPAADAAWKELDDYARSGALPEDVVRKCDQLAEKLRGTKYERRWLDLREASEARRSKSASEQELRKKLERAGALIAQDTEFARYPEISELLREAENDARAKHIDLLPEVDELKRRYVEPYEGAAKKWANEKSDWLLTLEREKHYRDAISVIGTFPEKYKHSTVWTQLEKQRDNYKRILGQMSSGQDTKTWQDYCTLGLQDVGNKNFPAARANYKKALEKLPTNWREKVTADEKKSVLGMFYNLGCLDAVDAKKAEGEEKASLQSKALDWIEKSFKDGLFKTACSCHGKWMTHVETDNDLDELRAHPRFKELLTKYGPQ